MSRWKEAVAARLRDFWLSPIAPDALAFLRLALSSLALLQLAILAPHLLELYGNYGLIQWAVVEETNSAWAPSIGKVALLLAKVGVSSVTTVYALFALYAVSLMGLLVGYRTRVCAVTAWLTHGLTVNSGYYSLYGVDTMMHILFFYLMFAPAGAKWSLDVIAGRASPAPSASARLALRLIQLHLCIIYLNTGLAKASGTQWWNGEAIWRALMQPQFNVADVSWLAEHPWIPMAIGYSVLLVEAGYAVLIWIPRARVVTLLATIAMHVGIAASMRLWLFSMVMIAFNLTAFGFSAWAPRRRPASDEAPAAPGAELATAAG